MVFSMDLKFILIVFGGLILFSLFIGFGKPFSSFWLIDQNVTQNANGSLINFIDLNDTQDSYSGFGLDCVIVNSDENGLIFSGCATGTTDTTLDSNTIASDSYLGTPHDWNADQNFSRINAFDLNIGKGTFTVDGKDYNILDLNLNAISACLALDSNSLLNSSGECIKVSDLQIGGSDTNCSVSGSCSLIPYKDRDETIEADANWTFTQPLRVGSLFPFASGNTLGSTLGRQWNQLFISENGVTFFNCQVGSNCSDEAGYFYLEPNAGDDQNNFFIDFSAFKNIINVVSDPYQLILYDKDYSKRWFVDANGNSWFDGNVSVDLNLFVDGNAFVECVFFEDGTSICTQPLDNQNASDINFNMLETPVFFTLEDWFNTTQSSGRLFGGDFIHNGGGVLTVTNGSGIIKSTDSNIGVNYFFDWDTNTNVELFVNKVTYIFVDYNAGHPFIATTNDISTINHTTQFTLGRAWTNGIVTHALGSGINLYDTDNLAHERLIEVRGFERASGGVIFETGILNIASTAGVFYLGSNRITTSSQDTNDVAVTFTSWYRDGNGGWTEVIDQNQIDNLNYDDGTGTLNELLVNRYGIHWVFIHYDSDLHIVYGRDEYTLNEAEIAVLPSDLPEAVSDFGIVAGKIIVQKNAVTFTSIASAYTVPFPISHPAVHNDLSGLQGGTADEYYHLTSYWNQVVNDWNGSVQAAQLKDFSDITNRLFSLLTLDDVSGLDSFFVNESDYPFDDQNALIQDLNLNQNDIIDANKIYADGISVGSNLNPTTGTLKRGILVGGDDANPIDLTGTGLSYRALSSELYVVPESGKSITANNFSVAPMGANNILNLIGSSGYLAVMGAGGYYTGTVTNMMGYYILSVIDGSATVTNAYGLKITDITGATNNYAIYTGLGKNVFGDDLNVTGDMNISGDLNVFETVYAKNVGAVDVNASGVVRSISANEYSALDGNFVKAGSNPLARMCNGVTSDGNITYGWC